MQRRRFWQSLGAASFLPSLSSQFRLAGQQSGGSESRNGTRVLLPSLASAAPLPEAVLFAFDDQAFPFRDLVQTHLIPGDHPQFVLDHGPEGSHDEVLLYYGTVIRIGDTFHMWYNGHYERKYYVVCYATSKDGVQWVKPSLGLVEFRGSKDNNITEFTDQSLWSTAAVLYEPEDPDPDRRFKMIYEVDDRRFKAPPAAFGKRFSAAFSSDGLRWKHSPRNPVGPSLEMAGITKFRGLYYVNGQSSGRQHVRAARKLITFASADFENWSPCGALGLDRSSDLFGPSIGTEGSFVGEQIHLGAALWNRGNVILGIYGQWHGDLSGDRRLLTMDLGLAVSHNAIHFHEPIPGYRFIPAMEQPGSPIGVHPTLQQGQGIENVGERTLYWYSLWRGGPGSGVRMVSWGRDRLGMLKPYQNRRPRAISCPIRVVGGQAKVYVNASGLGDQSQLRIELMDEGFRPLPGYNGVDAPVLGKDGFRIPVSWRGGDVLTASQGLVRVDVQFEGVRPEEARLYAVYVGS